MTDEELDLVLKTLRNRIEELEEDLDEVRQLLPRYWELHSSIVELLANKE